MRTQVKQMETRSIIPIASAVVLGFAVWNLIDGFIRYIFSPLIAAFIGNSRFQLNSFSINASEVPYGAFLETVFVVIGVILLLWLVLPDWKQFLNGSSGQNSKGE